MKVYLDDIRETPEGWVRVYTAGEAIALLQTGRVQEISLDHDLGDACKFCIERDEEGIYKGTTCIASVCSCGCHSTGYDVAAWIEEAAWTRGFKVPVWKCHSANPAGKARIEAAMRTAEKANA